MKKTRTWPHRLGAAAAVALTAGSGRRSTDPESKWYLELEKPSWQPPRWAFPVVWTSLYTDIAAVSGQVLAQTKQAGDEQGYKEYARQLAANLVLNAGWSRTFFKSHKLGPAAAVAVGLAVSSARLSKTAGKHGRPLGLALKPYVAWTVFAAILSFEIWRLNPDSGE